MNPRAALTTCTLSRGVPSASWVLLQAEFIAYEITGGENISSGEDGIRTHAPFRTNGFQDRLVMTTSIPLQSIPLQISAKNILTKMDYPVNTFLKVFVNFFRQPYSESFPRSPDPPVWSV